MKKLLIFLAVVVLLSGIVLTRVTRKSNNNNTLPQESVTITPVSQDNKKEELKIEDIKVGAGNEATTGKKVTVNYKGTLTDGTQFDSSYDRGTPFSFTIGSQEVIEGWDKGVAGMKVGGTRKLTIPPSLGYGARDLGAIPANSTLIFEIELLKVE